MRLTQGTFSFLPDLTREQIVEQIEYALGREWAVSIEYTDDPHPRNTYWEMYGPPMFDVRDAEGIMVELDRCLAEFPDHYVKVNAFDATPGWETIRLSFIVNRPSTEPGFRLQRTERDGRNLTYTTHAYAVDRPAGQRYGAGG